MSHELPHPMDVTRSVSRSQLTRAARRATCAVLLLLSGTAAAQSRPADAEPDAAPVPEPAHPGPPLHAAHGHHGLSLDSRYRSPGLAVALSLTPVPVDFGNLYAENLGWGIAYTAVELSLVAPMMWFVGGHMDHGRDDTRDWSESERNGMIALVSVYVAVKLAAATHAGYTASDFNRAGADLARAAVVPRRGGALAQFDMTF